MWGFSPYAFVVHSPSVNPQHSAGSLSFDYFDPNRCRCRCQSIGGIKGKITGVPVFRGALQTMFIGGLVAAAAFGIAHVIS